MSTGLNILHTVEFYFPHIGGAETVVQKISEELVRRGHRVTVATTRIPQRTFKELNGVNIDEFTVEGSLTRGFKGADVVGYMNYITEHTCDVMMNYAAQQWATDLSFRSLAHVNSPRVNLIAPCGYSAMTEEFNLRWPEFAKYFNQILPAVLPRYDAAIYHSAAYKDYLFARHLNIANGVVVPNGVDEEEFEKPVVIDFREKYGITAKHILLCVANFLEDKGHERLLNAFRELDRDDTVLVLVGMGERPLLERLKSLAAQLPVKFLVDITREDTIAAFKAADLFVFASRIEVFPLVIVEAKASRIPFVSTDCGNVKELKGGVVCAPQEIAANIHALLDDEESRRRLAEEGYQEYREKFTWKRVVDRYEELYLQLYQQKRSVRQENSANR